MQRDVLLSHIDHTSLRGAVKTALISFKETVKHLGLDDPHSALKLYHIALLHQILGKGTQAAAFIQKSHCIFETHFAGDTVRSVEALRFLGGDCVSRMPHRFPSADAHATLVSVDITAEIQHSFKSGQGLDHAYEQALLTWGCTPFPELPDYRFANIISLVIRSDQVEAFGRLIGKRLIRDEKVSTITGLTGLLQEWKQNLGLPSGSPSAPALQNKFVFGATLPPAVSWNQAPLETENHDFLYDASEKLSELFSFIELSAANSAPVENTGSGETPVVIPPAVLSLSQKKHPAANDQTENTGKVDMIEYYTPQTHAEMDKPLNAIEELADLVTSRLKSNNLLSLDELIGERQEKKLVRKLFNRNEARYKQFVKQINEIADWKTASETLESFYVQVGVSHYDKAALELSDMVYHRYFPAETDALKVNKFKW